MIRLREDRPATIEEHRQLRMELVLAAGKIEQLHAQVSRMRSALLMGVQLAESGGHSAVDPQPACPTCHFLREAKEALR